MLKLFLLVTCILLVILGIIYSNKDGNELDYVVFAKPLMKFPEDNYQTREGANLSEEDIEKYKLIFLKYLDEQNIKKDLKPMEKYKVQYFGSINKENQKIVEGNYFCLRALDSHPDWKIGGVSVDGGGNCFFRASININTEKILHFEINEEY